eukprot:2731664-Rhodomonas_salina.1
MRTSRPTRPVSTRNGSRPTPTITTITTRPEPSPPLPTPPRRRAHRIERRPTPGITTNNSTRIVRPET